MLRAWKKPDLGLDPELGHGGKSDSDGTLKVPPIAKVSEKTKVKSPMNYSMKTPNFLKGGMYGVGGGLGRTIGVEEKREAHSAELTEKRPQ